MEALLVVDRIARAAFVASGAYLVGSFAFRLLGVLVGDGFEEIERSDRKGVIGR